MKRPTATGRTLQAGCFVCHNGEAQWTGPNAQGLAARHHDSTQHATWCDVVLTIRYGTTGADSRQIDIEDAIAGCPA
jgi:cytochrome c551/c552